MSYQKPINLDEWILIKNRGALVRTGAVYRSQDSKYILRTGGKDEIQNEADFAQKLYHVGFPIPAPVERGEIDGEVSYFVETSVGNKTFGEMFASDYRDIGKINDDLFKKFTETVKLFAVAQLDNSNRELETIQLVEAIQLGNVLLENPDLPEDLINTAMEKFKKRTNLLPVVISHGDFTPFNIMEGGVIDFETRVMMPFGYDIVTGVVFQKFWDHPKPNGSGTMKLWDFSNEQLTSYFDQIDMLCKKYNISNISDFKNDFIFLKSIWALSYEKDEVYSARWEWRKKVMLSCMHKYISDLEIDSNSFPEIGLQGGL